MERTLERLRSQVQALAGKYAETGKRKELEQVFDILGKELKNEHVQSQRIMALLRAVMSAQPGSAKAVNEFLSNPVIAKIMSSGGGYNLD